MLPLIPLPGSPIPGLIAQLQASVGAKVTKGDKLLMMEAMKMQNEIQAPRAGRLTSLRATPGQTVNAGEILATIE